MRELLKSYLKPPLIFLRAGLILTLLMILVVSYSTIQQTKNLSQISQDMYQHPFLVSNACLKLESDIAHIRIGVLQIASTDSVSEIKRQSKLIDAQVIDVDHQLTIISTGFLGDIRRVNDLKSELNNWSTYRNKIITQTLEGKLSKEEKTALTAGTFTYQKITSDLDYISTFAGNRAIQFIQEAELQSSTAIDWLICLTLFGVLILMCGALYVFKTIHNYIQELEQYAQTDPLTGLLNRRQFQRMTDYEFAKHTRGKIDMTVMMIDIDHFKKINDQHGHAVGDDVLVDLATTLREALRDTDLVCRWGEEVVLLLPGIGEIASLEIASRLNIKVERSAVQVGNKIVNYTVSIGISAFSSHANMNELIRQADLALYYVKNNGRNSAITYSSVKQANHVLV